MNNKNCEIMKLKMLYAFMVLILYAGQVWGQTNDLTQEDMDQLLKQTKLKVDQFNNYISFIAKKEKYASLQQQQETEKNKDEYIKEALKLFIGGGDAFVDEYGNQQPARIMQVSCLLRNGKVRVKNRKIRLYLNNLKSLNYSDVQVTAGDAFFTSEARQIGENKYMTTLSYRQFFIGKSDGRVVYDDKTDKTITVYIERQVIDGRSRWAILLGDIKVDATER